MEENPILKASLSMASDIPLYAQLTGIIKNTITSGTLRVGDLLPSEAELCDKFEISRNTVRQAIGSLEEAGFVVRKRGKGTFVADPSTRRKGVQYSFTTEIAQIAFIHANQMITPCIIQPGHLPSGLAVAVDAMFCQLLLRRMIDRISDLPCTGGG